MPDASSNFAFVRAGWPDLHHAAVRAERHARSDPRAACFYARLTLERAVYWLYDNDAALPYVSDDRLGTLLHEPAFKQLLGRAVWPKTRVIQRLGNDAVHDDRRVPVGDAEQAVRELHHVLYWLARHYTSGKSPSVPAFDVSLLPDASGQTPVSSAALAAAQAKLEAEVNAAAEERLAKLQTLADQLAQKQQDLADQEAALAEARKRLEAEREAERQAIAQTRAANEVKVATASTPHDYNEAQTRAFLVDLLLREAGWLLDDARDREYPVTGMPTPSGTGSVDYVLWGDDGRPLAVVEAKRSRKDLRVGKTQAKHYADALETEFGRRPVIFYTNGYEVKLWDDAQGYPPRDVLGFYTKAELDWLIHQRTARRPLAGAKVETQIAGRAYQTEAIRRVTETFASKRRRALLVMATGTGKTRTAIALVKLLVDQGWVKRVLFLADRTALLKQAAGAFRDHVPSLPQANLSDGDDPEGARVVFATYPAMANAVDHVGEDGSTRVFTPGSFDLVIVDEAHRSVYNRYRVLFDYFDALLLGLTATPRDEVDRDTYRLFQLHTGDPTFAYELESAVDDGFLVPPREVEVPLKFPSDGITYAELSDEEREEYEAKLVDEETGEMLARVDSDAVNRWLFNEDTVDKALAVLMERGLRVDGGDQLGKTIVFARNTKHARFIKERFDWGYPGLGGSFADVIVSEDSYAESLLSEFYVADREPVVAISVDMLDTGIDVPEVVNLVFFKPVRSRVKFHQMVGRGTRLRPDLFGPGEDKRYFLVFDLGGNFAFFDEHHDGAPQSQGESVSARLFKERLRLAMALGNHEDRASSDLRAQVLNALHRTVEAMNPESVLVRPHRRLRDDFAERARWDRLTHTDVAELERTLAALPSEQTQEHERTRRFDLATVQAQRALAEGRAVPDGVASRLTRTAERLAEKQNVAAIQKVTPTLDQLKDSTFWGRTSPPELEGIRERVRRLAPLASPDASRDVFTDFEDELGEVTVREPRLGASADLAAYRRRVEQFVRDHENHLAISKLRHNQPLTQRDLDTLEALLFQADAAGTREDFEAAYGEQPSLGLFVRSLVGLDRTAAKEALANHLDASTFNAKQIRFIDTIVDELTSEGVMDVGRLYRSPYIDLHARGLDGLFSDAQADGIVTALRLVRANAAA